VTTTITVAHDDAGWSLTVNGEVWFSGLTFREANQRRRSLEWWARPEQRRSAWERITGS